MEEDLYSFDSIDRERLLEDEKKSNTFRILKGNPDSLFYAFLNGRQINGYGEKSYRSALRKHIIPKLIDIARKKESSTLVFYNEMHAPEPLEIKPEDINEFINKYSYKAIIDKYGNGKESFDMHVIIDDWNQLANTDRDLTKINPHDIKISDSHEITIQELEEKQGDWFHDSYFSHCFINGMPIEAYETYEIETYKGLVIGEKEVFYDIDEIEVIVDKILENNQKHSYIIYGVNRQPKNFIEETSSLPNRVESALVLRKVYQK